MPKTPACGGWCDTKPQTGVKRLILVESIESNLQKLIDSNRTPCICSLGRFGAAGTEEVFRCLNG